MDYRYHQTSSGGMMPIPNFQRRPAGTWPMGLEHTRTIFPSLPFVPDPASVYGWGGDPQLRKEAAAAGAFDSIRFLCESGHLAEADEVCARIRAHGSLLDANLCRSEDPNRFQRLCQETASIVAIDKLAELLPSFVSVGCPSPLSIVICRSLILEEMDEDEREHKEKSATPIRLPSAAGSEEFKALITSYMEDTPISQTTGAIRGRWRIAAIKALLRHGADPMDPMSDPHGDPSWGESPLCVAAAHDDRFVFALLLRSCKVSSLSAIRQVLEAAALFDGRDVVDAVLSRCPVPADHRAAAFMAASRVDLALQAIKEWATGHEERDPTLSLLACAVDFECRSCCDGPPIPELAESGSPPSPGCAECHDGRATLVAAIVAERWPSDGDILSALDEGLDEEEALLALVTRGRDPVLLYSRLLALQWRSIEESGVGDVHGGFRMMKTLLKLGADPTSVSVRDGRSVVELYAERVAMVSLDDMNVYESMIAAAIQLHGKTTPALAAALRAAALSGLIPAVGILADFGVPADLTEPGDEYTPLCMAALAGKVETVYTLLARGANPVQGRGCKGLLARVLRKAATRCETVDTAKFLEIAQKLIDAGCDANCPEDTGGCPLFWVSEFDDYSGDLIRKLLEHGADPLAMHPEGRPLLQTLLCRDRVDAFGQIVGIGADVIQGKPAEADRLVNDIFGRIACETDGLPGTSSVACHYAGVVDVLISKRSDRPVPIGWLPLACEFHLKPATIEKLIRSGAKPRQPGRSGRMPMWWTINWGNVRSSQILLDAGASLWDARPFCGPLPKKLQKFEVASEIIAVKAFVLGIHPRLGGIPPDADPKNPYEFKESESPILLLLGFPFILEYIAFQAVPEIVGKKRRVVELL